LSDEEITTIGETTSRLSASPSALVPTHFTIALNGEELVRVHGDGSIEFGPNYTPDAAAAAFWDAISKSVPNLTAPPPAETPFGMDLTSLINAYSRENGSDTPDFILAGLIVDILAAFDKATVARDRWYGHKGLRAKVAAGEPLEGDDDYRHVEREAGLDMERGSE
jgi:hypothetical protein